MAVIDAMRAAVRQLRSRVDAMVVRAAAKVLDDAKGTQRVQLVIFDDEDEVEDEVEHMQPWGFSAQAPNPDDLQAIGLALGGARSATVAILVHSPSQRPTDGEADSAGLWNSAGWQVYVNPDGEVHLGASDRVAAAALARADRVATELDRIKGELDGFKTTFDAHTHVVPGGGSYPGGTAAAPVTGFPSPATPGDTDADNVYGT